MQDTVTCVLVRTRITDIYHCPSWMLDGRVIKITNGRMLKKLLKYGETAVIRY